MKAQTVCCLYLCTSAGIASSAHQTCESDFSARLTLNLIHSKIHGSHVRDRAAIHLSMTGDKRALAWTSYLRYLVESIFVFSVYRALLKGLVWNSLLCFYACSGWTGSELWWLCVRSTGHTESRYSCDSVWKNMMMGLKGLSSRLTSLSVQVLVFVCVWTQLRIQGIEVCLHHETLNLQLSGFVLKKYKYTL